MGEVRVCMTSACPPRCFRKSHPCNQSRAQEAASLAPQKPTGRGRPRSPPRAAFHSGGPGGRTGAWEGRGDTAPAALCSEPREGPGGRRLEVCWGGNRSGLHPVSASQTAPAGRPTALGLSPRSTLKCHSAVIAPSRLGKDVCSHSLVHT